MNAMLERKRSRGMGKYARLSILFVFVGLMIMVIVVFKKYQLFKVPGVLQEPDEDFAGILIRTVNIPFLP